MESTGEIGGNDALVREQCYGGTLIPMDRRWHCPEGVHNPRPVWPNHGIRILSGPSPLWLDATGRRLPVPLFPGFDSLGTLRHVETTGHDDSWFVLNTTIISKAGFGGGFAGGGRHGCRCLEGNFLGGCLFSGRTTGRHAAAAIRA